MENNKSLLKLNTFGVNCFAEKFISIKNTEDLKESLYFLTKNNTPHFVLGGGSNILLTQNIKGLVLHNQITGINILKEDQTHVIINIGAGVIWNDLVNWSIENGLWGIENLILIPGTVGAAPIQNIGAYGVEIKNVFLQLTAFEIKTGEQKIFKNNECGFKYRNSIFKEKLKNRFIITEVQLKLNKTKKPILNYESLRIKFEKENITPSLRNIGRLISEIRTSKLPSPNKIGNSGSFFKNPIIKHDLFKNLKKSSPNIKYFSDQNNIKLSAGWLIEQCGWKGKRIKEAGVYEKQALVLINFGKATGSEIKELSEKIKHDVKNKFNVILENEVQII